MKLSWLGPLLAVSLVSASAATAGGSACDGLDKAQNELAAAVLSRVHPYDCCDRTLAECIKKKPSRLVTRLREAVCRRVAAHQDRATIERALDRRATSMLATGKKYAIDLSREVVAGDAQAPVTVVLYACPRCPFCAREVLELYRAVTTGPLKGRVRMYVRMYPLRSHPGSTEAAMAVMAARQLGHYWGFLLELYRNFDHFSVAGLPEQAKASGLDVGRFRELLSNSGLRKSLVESKKEGVRNGVDATPTLFVNGRKYVGDLELNEVIDVLDEEFDRVTGKSCE